ncbi:hypothetical protein BGO18_01120 [Candidatus Saccharibacteria bacterium 47-87]|nr:MAG: hypothetical protein BGO18_01120 [Candidatus Saccharibacteria bacterium 47-87]
MPKQMTTFQVVNTSAAELYDRLYASGGMEEVEFEAIPLDDPGLTPASHTFRATLIECHLEDPVSLDLRDSETPWWRLYFAATPDQRRTQALVTFEYPLPS